MFFLTCNQICDVILFNSLFFNTELTKNQEIYKIGTLDHSGLAHVPACKTLGFLIE